MARMSYYLWKLKKANKGFYEVLQWLAFVALTLTLSGAIYVAVLLWMWINGRS